jgi:HSP20 family molecular chaperone IbpA
MYKKIVKIASFITLFYTTMVFADIDMQKGVYDAAEEMMAMDEKMNRAIDEHNRQNWDDEDMELVDISINDFEETQNGYQLIKEIPDANETEVSVQVKDGILTISTVTKMREISEFSESVTMSSSASSLFIPTDADENRVQESYINGVLKITLLKK